MKMSVELHQLHQSGTLWTTLIYAGPHKKKKNVLTMIVNSSNSLSRGESGERANVARSYLATMQNNNKYTKPNPNVI